MTRATLVAAAVAGRLRRGRRSYWPALVILAGGLGCETSKVSGSTSGQLAAGKACTSNVECHSGICGVDGTGNCCATGCSTANACGATGCDTSGACSYPVGGASCGSCVGSMFSAGACNGAGRCVAGIARACPDDLACNDAGSACNSACSVAPDCASGFYCAKGACVPKIALGSCTTNDACVSGICGADGSGDCCAATCSQLDAQCGAINCDATTGACIYPGSGVACGSMAGSCSGDTQSNPSACDGKGDCSGPGTTPCAPYLCGPSACLTSCTGPESCVAGGFCDIDQSACCAGLASGASLAVDVVTGSDAIGCCGIGTNRACQSLARAMRIINDAQASGVELAATVDGGGGDWTSAKESFPVELGWGVELNAPGVYISDPSSASAIFDLGAFYPNDTVGYASIVGLGTNPIGIGMNRAGDVQTTDASAIAVQTGRALYLANATLNGSANLRTTAITLEPGGSLTLGQDHSGSITGTVTIGNTNDSRATDGFDGILCPSGSAGCTIADAPLVGQSSVVFEGQEGSDIAIEGLGSVTLTSAPVFGLSPRQPGFQECPGKPEAKQGFACIDLEGSATLTLKNATVQCSANSGIYGNAQGARIEVDHTTIQNTEQALEMDQGSATVSNSLMQFNFNAVLQSGDGVIDLSGGDAGGTNTIICSSELENTGISLGAGVNVANQSTTTLNASNVAWDTPGPDVFSCGNGPSNCMCQIPSCIVMPGPDGADGMDVVSYGGAVITTTGNSLSPLGVAYGCK